MIDLLNQAGAFWAEYFGLAVIQNTVFLLVVFFLLHRLKDAPASVKQILATVALVKLLLPPFLPMKLGLPTPGAAPSVTEAASSVIFLRPVSPSAADPAITAGPELSVWGMLFAVWVVAALALLAGSVVATARLAWSLRRAEPVDDPVSAEVLRFTGVRVRRSERIGMPLTLGPRPRTIFVPPLWDQWTADCRRRVLQHELAHIHRFDGLFQMLQIWVRALYFFHPLVRVLNRRLGEYREMACDDASAGFGREARLAYSRCLVEIAESVTRGPNFYEPASTLLGRKRELTKRVIYQTEGGVMSTMSKTKKGVLLAAVVSLALPLSLYVSDSISDSPTEGVAQAAPAKPEEGPRTITLAIEGGDVQIASDEAAKRLTEEMAKVTLDVDENAVVKILCEDDATMAVLFAVQDMLVERGLYRVVYGRTGKKGLPLVLPSRDLQARMAEIAPENLAVLHLTESGTVLLDGSSHPEDRLFKKLTRRLAANDHLVVSITADEGARFKQFVDALARTKAAGAQRISVGKPVS